MKTWATSLALIFMMMALPSVCLAQGGFYGWTVSASPADPFDNNPAHPGAGFQILYLWYLQPCGPGPSGAGMSAAEFKLVTTNTDWTISAVVVQNGFLNGSQVPPDATGANLLLAVGGCPATQMVAAQVFVMSTTNPGVIGIGFTDNDPPNGLANQAVVVDCEPSPGVYAWPSQMRFVGYATSPGVNQNHGSDCTTTAVADTPWGAVKALYR